MKRFGAVLLLATGSLSCAAVVSFDGYREPGPDPPPAAAPPVTLTVHCISGAFVVFHDAEGVVLDAKPSTDGVATTTTAATQVTVAVTYSRAYYATVAPAGEPASWSMTSFVTYVGVERGDVLNQTPRLRTKDMDFDRYFPPDAVEAGRVKVRVPPLPGGGATTYFLRVVGDEGAAFRDANAGYATPFFVTSNPEAVTSRFTSAAIQSDETVAAIATAHRQGVPDQYITDLRVPTGAGTVSLSGPWSTQVITVRESGPTWNVSYAAGGLRPLMRGRFVDRSYAESGTLASTFGIGTSTAHVPPRTEEVVVTAQVDDGAPNVQPGIRRGLIQRRVPASDTVDLDFATLPEIAATRDEADPLRPVVRWQSPGGAQGLGTIVRLAWADGYRAADRSPADSSFENEKFYWTFIVSPHATEVRAPALSLGLAALVPWARISPPPRAYTRTHVAVLEGDVMKGFSAFRQMRAPQVQGFGEGLFSPSALRGTVRMSIFDDGGSSRNDNGGP